MIKLITQQLFSFDYYELVYSKFTFDRINNQDEILLSKEIWDNLRSLEGIKQDSKFGDCQPLDLLFIPQNLSITDFKKINKNDVISYLKEYFIEDEEVIDNFQDLKDMYEQTIAIINNHAVESYYVLDKRDFNWNENENNNKTRGKEYMLYSYYMLLVWIDDNEKYVYSCELYDD